MRGIILDVSNKQYDDAFFTLKLNSGKEIIVLDECSDGLFNYIGKEGFFQIYAAPSAEGYEIEKLKGKYHEKYKYSREIYENLLIPEWVNNLSRERLYGHLLRGSCY